MDGDSSGDERDSFTTTEVLLGYASREETDDSISHLGGVPSWISDTAPSATLATCLVCNDLLALLLQLHADLPDAFPGHDRRLHIFACRRKTCRRKKGSVRVLRSTRVDPAHAAEVAGAKEEEQKQKQQPDAPKKQSAFLGTELFGGAKPAQAGKNANPFSSGAGSGAAAAANPFSLGAASSLASKPPQEPSTKPSSTPSTDEVSSELPTTFAQQARISAPSPDQQSSQTPSAAPFKPWPTSPSSLPKPHPTFFLDADYEALGADPPAPSSNTAAVSAQLMDVEDEEPTAAPSKAVSSSKSKGKGKSSADDDDVADSAMDTTFQKFADRLWHNPEQVLRYEFSGKPLLYSKADEVGKMLGPFQGATATTTTASTGIPACATCGGRRVFECQLTPHAIVELEGEDEVAAVAEGMEWGTVIVGVCARDCLPAEMGEGGVGYVEEWAGVQWEESKK